VFLTSPRFQAWASQKNRNSSWKSTVKIHLPVSMAETWYPEKSSYHSNVLRRYRCFLVWQIENIIAFKSKPIVIVIITLKNYCKNLSILAGYWVSEKCCDTFKIDKGIPKSAGSGTFFDMITWLTWSPRTKMIWALRCEIMEMKWEHFSCNSHYFPDYNWLMLLLYSIRNRPVALIQ